MCEQLLTRLYLLHVRNDSIKLLNSCAFG